MITGVLFIIIGIKLNIFNGWYAGLLIAKIFLDILSFGIKCLKLGSESD